MVPLQHPPASATNAHESLTPANTQTALKSLAPAAPLVYRFVPTPDGVDAECRTRVHPPAGAASTPRCLDAWTRAKQRPSPSPRGRRSHSLPVVEDRRLVVVGELVLHVPDQDGCLSNATVSTHTTATDNIMRADVPQATELRGEALGGPYMYSGLRPETKSSLTFWLGLPRQLPIKRDVFAPCRLTPSIRTLFA